MEWLSERIHTAGEDAGANGTWLRLTEDLLRHCRDGVETFAAALAARRVSAEEIIADLARESEALLAANSSAQVHPALANELVSLVAAHSVRWPDIEQYEVLAARALALGIDRALHEVFVERFRDRGRTHLQPGSAYPVHRYNLLRPTRLIEGSPNTRPETVTATPYALPRLRLADDRARDFRYVLDWDAYGRLAALAKVDRLRIAVCQPSLELDGEYDIDRSDDPPSPSFRNRGPIAPQHREVLLAQLEASVNAGAQVIVFPEYTVGVDDREAVFKRLQELTAGQSDAVDGQFAPVLVVAGTAEIEVASNTVRNQAILWMPRGEPIPLTKSLPAVLDGYSEDVDTGTSTVRVFMTERWAIAVLICRDAFEARIIRQLEDIGVNLVLVPAMTPKTGTLVGSVSSLPARSQTFVAVAVAPATWPGREDGRCQACFHGPYDDHPEPVLCPRAGEQADQRGVWLFDAYHREVDRLLSPEDG